MTGLFHTYGPTCLVADDEPDLPSLYSRSTPPDIRSHFFYISSLPIDDPLAPVPPPSGQVNESQRLPPNPFSARDNLALEASWREVGKTRQAEGGCSGAARPGSSKGRSAIAVPSKGSTLGVARHRKATNQEGSSLLNSRSSNTSSFPDEHLPRYPKSRPGDTRAENYAARRQPVSSVEDFADGIPGSIGSLRKRDRSSSLTESPAANRRSNSPPELGEGGQDVDAGLRANPSRDASISGSPFIRAPASPSQSPLGRSLESLPSKDGANEWQSEVRSSAPSRSAPKPSGLRATVSLDEIAQNEPEEDISHEDPQEKIPVGASRLHLVELPNLQVCVLPYYSGNTF